MGKIMTDIHIAGTTTIQVWSMLVKRGFSVTRRITLVMKVLNSWSDVEAYVTNRSLEESLTKIQQQTSPLTQSFAEAESSA